MTPGETAGAADLRAWPGLALRNLLERDRMVTERVRAEASDLGLRVIEVDIAMTEEELAGRASEAFGWRAARDSRAPG